MDMLTRDVIGLRPPTRRTPLSTPVAEVWIHHGAGSSADPVAQWRGYQRFHMDSNGWSDIAYNYGVGLGGEILEGRGADRKGGGTGDPEDSRSYSVCFVGNFEAERPTKAAIEACAELLRHLIAEGKLRADFRIYGDRDTNQTACPGRHLYARLSDIRALALEDPMPTLDDLDRLRISFNRREPDAVRTVQDYLRAGGWKPGRSDGKVGARTIAALERAGVGGDPSKLGPAGFARIVFSALGGKLTETPIIEVPGDCSAVEAELAKARGIVADQATRIDAARQALDP